MLVEQEVVFMVLRSKKEYLCNYSVRTGQSISPPCTVVLT